MWRLFVSGLIMGVPLIYTIAFLMALPSTSALNAAAIAIIPAVFCGWSTACSSRSPSSR